MENYQEYLAFAKEIAMKAGEIMLKYFHEDNGSSYKGDRTIVTLADKEINSYLIQKVKENYPSHSVDGEEQSSGLSDHVWVCDPVDGTAMYARHVPTAVFSLALVIDGVSVVGVVYDPFTDNLYSAAKGHGCYQNGKRITVNDYEITDMRSVINYDMWRNPPYDIYGVIEELTKSCYVVSIGSVIRGCMCVASGDFTAAIFPGTEHKNCDIAASKIIVEEAGGIVTDLFGDEQRYDVSINGALVANPKAYPVILKELQKQLINKKK